MTSLIRYLRREINRTLGEDALEMRLDESRRYVRLSDGQCAWWQPASELWHVLETLPDATACNAAEDEAGHYGDWCRATAHVGYFGHNAAEDTMPTPADFDDRAAPPRAP